MKLRSRIMIITFMIILFVQGLNCVLEIGFLANNVEEANLRKYRIIGNQMMRKLNTSLLFGKSLDSIDYDRLLSTIIPADVENVYIINPAGTLLYSEKKATHSSSFHSHNAFFDEKTSDVYQIFFPLTDRTGIKGNLVIKISNQKVKEKRFSLIRKSMFTFLIILAISLPLLYLLLTVFINRPYNRFITDIETWFSNGDYQKLKENHIDISPLIESERVLKKIRDSEWLLPAVSKAYEESETGEGAAVAEKFKENLYQKLKRLMQISL